MPKEDRTIRVRVPPVGSIARMPLVAVLGSDLEGRMFARVRMSNELKSDTRIVMRERDEDVFHW